LANIPCSKQLTYVLFYLLFPFSGVALANQDQQTNVTSSTEPWVAERPECHALVTRYLEWHSIAIALGKNTDDLEHQWLRETGLLNDESPEEFHQNYVNPEQEIDSFESVAATCAGDPSSLLFSGELIVNSRRRDGQAMRHVFLQQGPDSYSIKHPINSAEGGEFLALSNTYLLQLPFLKEYYHQVIRQLDIKNPTNLTFTEEEVELWLAWPSGILMTSEEHINTESLKSGQTRIFDGKKTYVTALTESDQGVRLSSRYPGKHVPNTTLTDAQILDVKRNMANACLENFSFCLARSGTSIRYHYYINSEGSISQPIIDELYVNEVEKWLEDEFKSIELYEDLVLKMREHTKSKSEGGDVRFRYSPIARNMPQLHGKKLEKGKIYTGFGLPIHFDRALYPLPNFNHDLVSKELKYLGKTPCNAEDTDNSCAHLEYRLADLDPNELLHDKTSVEIAFDLILEPHGLLLHKVDYKSVSTTYGGADLSKVSSKTSSVVDILYSYEDLQE